MHLTPANIRPWARKHGVRVTDYACDRVLRTVIIPEEAYRCEACGDYFSDADDVDNDGVCADCAPSTFRTTAWESAMRTYR